MTDSHITYVVGDATEPVGDDNKLIAHVCNDVGAWGLGFVLALSRRWPEPQRSYEQWFTDRSSNDFGLGAVQIVQVQPDISVANMIGQRDIIDGPEGPPVRYDAIEAALADVGRGALVDSASVHMPRIGCGLAGGEWLTVEAIIERTLIALAVETFVYDLS